MEIITNWGRKLNGSLTSLNLSKVDAIALHHMANKTADIKTVQDWHLNSGWVTIGYNFWVGFDGKVYEGRGFNVGAGVLNQNGHIISIGFQGAYDAQAIMPDKQFNAGIDIINYIKSKVPTIKKVAGHKDFMATACPGVYFPLAEMQKLVKRKVVSIVPKEITDINEAKKLLREEAGLSAETIAFLDCYKYNEPLFLKIANAIQK